MILPVVFIGMGHVYPNGGLSQSMDKKPIHGD